MSRRWLDPGFFTDEKMKKATVPERLLAAAIIANQDDDGRLRGDPAYLRAIAFLYDDYSLEEMRLMRDHLAEVNHNIIVYKNDGEEYIQLKRYKRYQRPRYYRPSKFPPPPGWPFEEEPLQNNYKGDTEKTIQYEIANKLRNGQWQPTNDAIVNVEINKRLGNLYADIFATTESQTYILIEIKQYPLQFRDLGQIMDYRTEAKARGYTPIKGFLIGNGLGNLSLQEALSALITPLNLDLSAFDFVEPTRGDVTPTSKSVGATMVTLGEGKGLDSDLDLDLDKGEGEGRKSHPLPSPATSTQIYDQFVDCFEKGWGEKLSGKSLAQIRDFSQQLSAAGCPLSYVPEAFKEAASMNKCRLTYVRRILLDWLGAARSPPY